MLNLVAMVDSVSLSTWESNENNPAITPIHSLGLTLSKKDKKYSLKHLSLYGEARLAIADPEFSPEYMVGDIIAISGPLYTTAMDTGFGAYPLTDKRQPIHKINSEHGPMYFADSVDSIFDATAANALLKESPVNLLLSANPNCPIDEIRAVLEKEGYDAVSKLLTRQS